MAIEIGERKRLFTSDEYMCMAAAGLLPARGVELLEGEIVQERGDGSEHPWRFTGEEYLRLPEIGVLHDDERVELVDGEVIEMSPDGPDHAMVVRRLNSIFTMAYIPAGFEVGVQSTHVANPGTLPQPDLVVAPLLPGLVNIVDAILVVEVANTSLTWDRTRKRRLYAEAGAPCYWIVEVPLRQVRVLEDRSAGDYRSERVVPEGGRLTLPVVGTEIDVASFLPQP
jgi:Uma2 family endonuclease